MIDPGVVDAVAASLDEVVRDGEPAHASERDEGRVLDPAGSGTWARAVQPQAVARVRKNRARARNPGRQAADRNGHQRATCAVVGVGPVQDGQAVARDHANQRTVHHRVFPLQV